MSKEIKIEKNFTVRLKQHYIYIHRRKTNDEVFYVGKGKDHRWCNVYSRGNHWKNIANKHGVYCEIVANSLTESEAFILEKKLIALYGRLDQKTGTLVNLTIGGDGVCGYKYTPEQCKRKSELGKGRVHSPETIAKMCRVQKGRIASEESKRKLSEYRTGKKLPASTVLAMRPHHDSLQVKVLCVETGVIYDSMVLAANSVDGCGSCISKVCQMKRKKHKGFTWRYLTNDFPTQQP
jgi:hypothetical protein